MRALFVFAIKLGQRWTSSYIIAADAVQKVSGGNVMTERHEDNLNVIWAAFREAGVLDAFSEEDEALFLFLFSDFLSEHFCK